MPPSASRTSSEISIHALREEGDRSRKQPSSTARYFYPRPPRGGRRPVLALVGAAFKFLSTPSARRATHRTRQAVWKDIISIHALREEGDRGHPDASGADREFLSTPSARRATFSTNAASRTLDISIHALREEGDAVRFVLSREVLISIHALREEGDTRPPSHSRHR